MSHASVAHHVPGRIRIRILLGKDNPELLETIKKVYSRAHGVQRVEVSADTGSMVLYYDPEQVDDIESLIGGESARDEHRNHTGHDAYAPHHHHHHMPPESKISEMSRKLEEEAEFLADHSHTARVIVDAVKAVDRSIKRASGNNLDLKILIPLGLAGLTFLEIGAAAATPMWVTLVLFSINHFVEMKAHDMDDADDEAEAAPPRRAPLAA
jgi:cation transport ATPase